MRPPTDRSLLISEVVSGSGSARPSEQIRRHPTLMLAVQTSECAMHDVQPHVAGRRMQEGVRNGGEDLEAERRSACQDPALFERPAEMDLRRPAGKPFAFGAGPHFCLGAHLAKVVIDAGLRALIARAPTLKLAQDDAGVRWDGTTFYGVELLQVQV